MQGQRAVAADTISVTDQPPTLAEQIDAVEWATQQAIEEGRRRHPKLTPRQIHALVRRLEAAAEMLRSWEFGSTIAR
jgi:hypothetical protein